MKLIEHPGGERIEMIETGGGCFVVIGLAIVVWGAAVLSAGIGLTDMMDGQPLHTRAAVAFVGFLITAAGTGLALIRSGLIIDRSAMTAINWMGPLFPVKRMTTDLTRYQGLRFYGEHTGGRLDFKLDLVGPGGDILYNLEIFLTYEEGKYLSERVSSFTGMPLAVEPPPEQSA